VIRRILAIVLVVLGLVAIGLGIASATLWRSSDTVSASVAQQPDTPVVLVRPGVLGMVSGTVTVTATAASAEAPVVLAFAPAGDVAAWVGPAAHVDVTGLSSWTELSTERVDGEPTAPNPAGADLWTRELTGTGEVSVELTPDAGQTTLLVATDGTQAAPRITLAWPVESAAPYLVPLLLGGTLAVLLGLALLAYDALVRREVRARTGVRESRATADSTETTQMPAATAAVLTRRQLRERERARRASDSRTAPDGPVATTGGMVGAGILPMALDPERHRALRYVEPLEVAPLRSRTPAAGPDAEATEDRHAAAGPASGSAVVPGVERPEKFRTPAGAARGSAIVPGVPNPDDFRTPEGEEPERTSWRTLWDFGTDGTEEGR